MRSYESLSCKAFIARVQLHVDLQINPQEFVFQSSYDLQKLYLKPHNIPRTMMAYNHHHDLDLDFYAALSSVYRSNVELKNVACTCSKTKKVFRISVSKTDNSSRNVAMNAMPTTNACFSCN